ncbi:MAG: hypothetical protein ACOX1P_16980 [Thermoguttaceae bacterium]
MPRVGHRELNLATCRLRLQRRGRMGYHEVFGTGDATVARRLALRDESRLGEA